MREKVRAPSRGRSRTLERKGESARESRESDDSLSRCFSLSAVGRMAWKTRLEDSLVCAHVWGPHTFVRHTRVHTHRHARTHTHSYTHSHTRSHTHTHERIHKHMHARVHARVHARLHARTHSNTHANTHNTHTRTHAQIHAPSAHRKL